MFITKGRAMQNILQAIIEKGQASGQITAKISSMELTNMLFLVGRGVVFDWCLRDGDMNLREKMRKVIAIMTTSHLF